ncbi:hypothetical protein P4126_33820 [Pseudomonas aeruginosa]|nr:hypothetical protein [Pseudomonas aeruginosa]
MKSGRLDNQGGAVSSAGTLSLSSQGALNNQGGRVVTDAGAVLRSASLDNSQGGIVSAKGGRGRSVPAAPSIARRAA